MAEIIEIRQNWTPQEQKKLRVCAYARVSSDSDEQQYSYFGQVQHYTQMIQENPNWEYVDIYADSGKTGTKLDKRDDFNRMLEDCRAGKIDKILTKAVSRFARNVRDCVDAVKELKELGVTVYFEEQNLDSGRPQDFTAICIYATIAQEESMSISENLRMGNAARMRRGEYKQGCAPLGYIIQNGKFVIDNSQAETVKHIFKMCIDGLSCQKIADELNHIGAKNRCGVTKWNHTSVMRVLTNVRYKGDAIFQKSYHTGFPFKEKINRGEKPRYYLHNANDAIITDEEFEQAQKALQHRRNNHYKDTSMKPYALSKTLFCKECGSPYRSKTINGNLAWICRTRDLGADKCGSAEISDRYIKSAYVLLYNRLKENMELILQPMLAQAELCRISAAEQEAIEQLNMEIAQTTEQVLSINRIRAKGLIAPALYIEETNRLNRQVLDLRKKKKGFIHKNEFDSLLSNTKRLMQEIETTGAIADFDEGQFKRTVEKIYADTNTLTFRLINGLELEIYRDEVK